MAGSFALACKKFDCFNQVQAYDINKSVTDYAVENHIIDNVMTDDFANELRDSDFIVLGTPVSETVKLIPQLAESIKHKTIIFDLGSVKQKIRQTADRYFQYHPADFICAHPMVGSHHQGIHHCQTDLYQDKPFILIQSDKDESETKLADLVSTIKGQPVAMTCEEHDHMAAGLSHLPHLLAIAMVHSINSNAREYFDFSLAAGSFKDMTRVAQANPYLWHDIFAQNSHEIAYWWEQLKEQVDKNISYYQQQNSSQKHNGQEHPDQQLAYLEQAAAVRKSLESK